MEPRYAKINIIIGIIGALTGIISAWVAVTTFLSPNLPVAPVATNTSITSNTSLTSNIVTSNTSVLSNTSTTINNPEKTLQTAAIKPLQNTAGQSQNAHQLPPVPVDPPISSKVTEPDNQCGRSNPPVACLFRGKNQ